MNCPMHILIYKARQHSYRDLPIRLFEFGTVYRFERSGVLNGLLRVRGITQDDAHIFCTAEQLGTELADLLAFVLRILRAFGLTEFEAELATRPDKFVGDPAEWDLATEALRQALETAAIPYVVAEGEGPFYAPKIDVHVRDAIGRRWQVSTLQVDFQEPKRFEMEYVGADNNRHLPYMIHRALFGSVERFFAILLEHYAGRLPGLAVPDPGPHPAGAQRPPTVRRDRRGRAAQHRGPGRRGGRRRALGSRVRKAKLEKIPYVLRGRRRRRAGRYGRSEFPGKRPARPRRARGRFRGRSAGRDRDPCADGRSVVTSLERLWAGWRSEYVEHATTASDHDDGCVFCAILASDLPDEETLVVWRHPDGFAAAILNAYPYTSGHLMVLPLRHVADLDDRRRRGRGGMAGGRGGGAGPEAGVPTGRPQPGRQPGAHCGSRGAGPLPRARPAQVERRHQLHDPGRQHAVLPEALPVSAGKVRAAWPRR